MIDQLLYLVISPPSEIDWGMLLVVYAGPEGMCQFHKKSAEARAVSCGRCLNDCWAIWSEVCLTSVLSKRGFLMRTSKREPLRQP